MANQAYKTTIQERIPWKATALASNIPLTLKYDNCSLYEAVEKIALKNPKGIAFYFMGRKYTYKKMINKIQKCAKSFKVIGIRENDCVTIALPNCPQAIYAFYAVNLIGGIANMIHPLAGEKEIEEFLNISNSVTAITLDQFYHKFENVRGSTNINNIIICSIKDELSKPIKAGYMFTESLTKKKIPYDAPVIRWKKFNKLSKYCFYNYKVNRDGKSPAVMLYSGGTTGNTKGILLTNYNLNALAKQTIATNPMFKQGDRMLTAMPLFHGFGLAMCLHAMLASGGTCILIPRFTAKSYAKKIIKYKCNYIAGVPTLFEAILKTPTMKNADLSFLKGVYSGGDSLSIELKDRMDKFLYEHNAKIQVREGYGTTESVNGCCLTPPAMYRKGSIGIPFPDTYIKIVKPNSDIELKYEQVGEIVIAGPTIMKRYWDNPKETKATLTKSKFDGLTWLHTGDLGYMNKEGFIYFKGRSKRMIITSGYNVYPNQLENIIEKHPSVSRACIVGVNDQYKMQKIKGYVELNRGFNKSDELKHSILKHAHKYLAKYEMPYDIEFIDNMPMTKVGKIDYLKLEKLANSK